jgi:hypothetical protein
MRGRLSTLFLVLSLSFGLTAEAQTLLGPPFWQSQSSGFNTGPWPTQEAAIGRWLQLTGGWWSRNGAAVRAT